MEQKELIDNVIERCQHLTGGNNLSLKLQLLDLLLLIQTAVRDYDAKIKLLKDRPMIEVLTRPAYENYQQAVRRLINDFKVPFLNRDPSVDYNKHVTDYLFPGEMINTHHESAESVRLVINKLESELFVSMEILEKGIKNALGDLADKLGTMIMMVDYRWTQQQYESLANYLTQKYSNGYNLLASKAQRHYMEWKEGSYEDPEEYQSLMSSQLKKLLDSNFIIIEEDHLAKSYKKQLKVLNIYLYPEDCTDEYCKKFYFLSKLLGHEDGCFVFCKMAALGKYIYRHRDSLGTEEIEAFFYFQRICTLANEDIRKSRALKALEDGNTDGSSKADEKAEGDANPEETAIPIDYTKAIDKVLSPQFTLKGGIVLNSKEQINVAAAQIDLSSNVQVGMLMAIGIELNAVKASVNCRLFVRALIGLGILQLMDKEAINTMASGMNRKIKGWKDKKKNKVYPPLPANHLLWPSKDLPFGKKIYEAMSTSRP